MKDFATISLAVTLLAGLVIAGMGYSLQAKMSGCSDKNAQRAVTGLIVLGTVLSVMAIVQFMNGGDKLNKLADLRMMFAGVCAVVSVVVIALASLIYDKCKTEDKDTRFKQESIALIVLGVLSLGASGGLLYLQ